MANTKAVTTDTNYYDFDIDLDAILRERSALEEVLYVKDLCQRKFFLTTEIDQDSVNDLVRHIMQINREDAGVPAEQRRPILLYLSSNGGEVDAGFELIDIIQASITPVYTVNLGYQYSMGFLIGLAGHKRYAFPNAKFLHHDGTNIVANSTAKVKDQMMFQDRIEDRIREYVISRTKVSDEEYRRRMRQEWYLFADEAKEYGMVDYIIGVDCDINEIV